MREIKFRGYSGDGVWTYMTLNSGRWDFITFPLKEGSILNPRNWQQFTGLLDRHGKEIYKSDILKYGSNHPRIPKTIGEVIYYRGSFRLDFKGNKVHTYDTLDWSEEEMEIIGNIYQNSDLLK